MKETENSFFVLLTSHLKALLKLQKANNYDQLVYDIRVITFLTCALANILCSFICPIYSFPVIILTVVFQVIYVYTLVHYNNGYLSGLIFQACIVTFLIGSSSDKNNTLAMQTTTLACFVVYSMQFFPLIINAVFACIGSYFIVHQQRFTESLYPYDPDLLASLAPAGFSWLGSTIMIFIVINVFQAFNIRVWKAYTEAKEELLEKNQELHQANYKMEKMLQSLQEINQKLELSNKSLSEALKSQDLFIACVSHELRTPLNAMIGNIELMQLDTTDPTKKKMLKTCQICGEILLVMINNILDVAKINASRLEINVSAMNMSLFIEKIWSVSCPKILQKDLYGKLFISEDVPLWLKGDFHRLIQIIINLIGNATKFTTKGGVRVLINWERDASTENKDCISEDLGRSYHQNRSLVLKTDDNYVNEIFQLPNLSYQMDKLNQEKWILFSEKEDNFAALQERLGMYYNEKGILKVQVIDTGCGISSEAHSRIFEPFVQADSSITRKYGGTGLGLYIIKQLLAKMNGTITVSSEKDKGAKFTIRLPLSTISPEEAFPSKLSLSSTSQSLTRAVIPPVLIVDDSPYNQNILKTYLDTLNIPSEIADNGLDALNKVKAYPLGYYSMIMMDIQMPVMDGITASKRIRQYERDCKSVSSIPIIMITANCTSAEQNECMKPNGEIRATYFFRKPFSYSDCKVSVEAILAQRKMKAKKVLVVDDDAFNRELLCTQINRLGFDCEDCKNGITALQKLKENPDISVVLTDFEMPMINGIEFAKRIRQELMLKDVYIVGITGNVEEELNKQCLENGVNEILAKPVSLNQISSLLKGRQLL